MNNFYYMLVIAARAPNCTKRASAQYLEAIVAGLNKIPEAIGEDEVKGFFGKILQPREILRFIFCKILPPVFK